MKLTNPIVERLQTTHRGKGLIKDDAAPQLYLKIGKTGGAAWVRIAQAGGRRTENVIGHYPQLSLAEAQAKVAITTGAAQQRGNMTVRAGVERYLGERAKTLTKKTMTDLTYYLERDLAPLHKRPLAALTREAVKDIIAERALATPGAAKRLFAACKHFSWWCVDKNLLDVDPLAALRRKGLVAKDEPRERTLTEDEVRALMTADGQIARILKFALLTGQRIGEVLQITNDQINSDHWWTIPAEIRKIRREHQVYLSPEARRVYGKAGLYQYSYAAVSFWTKREGAQWRIHDLRRTAATLMGEHGVAPDTIDRCLGHQVGGRLAQTYQRATQRPAMRAAFEELGRQVAAIASGN